MIVPPRGARPRRGGRRPGWLLLTVLLVFAILASSALVFTDRVDLLKLAVILALWAAVAAAFASVIYRRQSDLDQAKARDLKLVYDLQLDREISARREYELTVESHLRRELASELRAQAADEVAALRAELAALRANLEILFDADLAHRPAIETDKATVRAAGRVTASRLDVPDVSDVEVTDVHAVRTEESPIIDVPAEPHPPGNDWAATGGAHRFPSQPAEQPGRRRRQAEAPQPAPTQPWPQQQPPEEPAAPLSTAQAPPPEPPSAWAPPPTIEEPTPADTGWQPAPAEGQWIPAGAPGSNWVASETANGSSVDSVTEYVGRRRAPDTPEPSESAEPVRGRHSASAGALDSDQPDTEQPAPVLAAEPAQPPPQPERPSRHGGADDDDEPSGQHAAGQSAAELLARFQTTPAEGGRRRRRDE